MKKKRSDYDVAYKIKVAKSAISARDNKIGRTQDVADVAGLPIANVNRWVHEYENGELIIAPVVKSKSSTTLNIDIVNAINQTNIRLDALYILLKRIVIGNGPKINIIEEEEEEDDMKIPESLKESILNEMEND